MFYVIALRPLAGEICGTDFPVPNAKLRKYFLPAKGNDEKMKFRGMIVLRFVENNAILWFVGNEE